MRFFAICAAWLAVAISACAENPIGSVIAIEGQATATGADGKSRAIALKSEIFANDKIATAKGSKIQIMFEDDSIISQGAESELTIDKYVYDPKGKKDNCSLRLAKGVFRAITGKITEMNPDKFKVQTKMATIGIRGCELGFRLEGEKEDIYVMELPPGKSVVITRNPVGKAIEEGREDRGQMLTVAEAGIAVFIQTGADPKERRITAPEARQIILDSTPAPPSSEGDKSGTESGSNLNTTRETVNNSLEKRDQTLLAQELKSQLLPSESPAPTTAPYVEPPTRPPPVLAGAGHPVMNDWDWGIWNDGYIEFYANTYQGVTFLTDPEFQAMLAVGQPDYLLTTPPGPYSMAGAVVYHAPSGATKTMTGSCSLQVLVGPSAAPKWGGSFNLASGVDSLTFTVDYASGGGKIGAGGVMSLNGPVASYSLNIPGYPTLNQGTLTSQSVNGRLIRTPAARLDPPAIGYTAPVGAASGEFHFQNGTAAKVDGAFGSDLR